MIDVCVFKIHSDSVMVLSDGVYFQLYIFVTIYDSVTRVLQWLE